MIRQRFSPVWLLAALALALAACTREDASQRAVALDLQEYMATFRKWEVREKVVFGALSEVEQSQYVDDDFVARTLKDALPDAEGHVREISEYRPKTRELTEVHERYRRGWEDLKVSLAGMISAVETKDYVALARAKSQMQSARVNLLKTLKILDAMLEENEQELHELKKS